MVSPNTAQTRGSNHHTNTFESHTTNTSQDSVVSATDEMSCFSSAPLATVYSAFTALWPTSTSSTNTPLICVEHDLRQPNRSNSSLCEAHRASLVTQAQAKKKLLIPLKKEIARLKNSNPENITPRKLLAVIQSINNLSKQTANLWQEQLDLLIQLKEPVFRLTYNALAQCHLNHLSGFNQCTQTLAKSIDILAHKFEKRPTDTDQQTNPYQVSSALFECHQDISQRLPLIHYLANQIKYEAQTSLNHQILEYQKKLTYFSLTLESPSLDHPQTYRHALNLHNALNNEHAYLWQCCRQQSSTPAIILLKKLGDDVQTNLQRLNQKFQTLVLGAIQQEHQSLKQAIRDSNYYPKAFINEALHTHHKLCLLLQYNCLEAQHYAFIHKTKLSIENMLTFIAPLAELELENQINEILNTEMISDESRNYFLDALNHFSFIKRHPMNETAAASKALLCVLDNLPIVLTGLVEQCQTIHDSNYLTQRQKMALEAWLTKLFYNEKTFLANQSHDLIDFNRNTQRVLSYLNQDASFAQRVTDQFADISSRGACTDWAASIYIDILAIHESAILEKKLNIAFELGKQSTTPPLNIGINFIKQHAQSMARLIRFSAFKQFLIVSESFDHTAQENIEHALFLYKKLQSTYSLPGGPVAEDRMQYMAFTQRTFTDAQLNLSLTQAKDCLSAHILEPHKQTHLNNLEPLGILIWRDLKTLCTESLVNPKEKVALEKQIHQKEAQIQTLILEHESLSADTPNYQKKSQQLITKHKRINSSLESLELTLKHNSAACEILASMISLA